MTSYVWSEQCNEAVQMDDAWVILNPVTFTVTKLNEAAGLCWNLLSEPRTSVSLAQILQENYEISEEEASRDVEAFLEQMQQIGLVRHAS
ncbi:PqqD family protein [Paenibacillus sp. 1P07SE]|uniref:PqqD family protein n=1 Tax=Paenibacillus sp. 1P07SE TaxID=3132209 RepID=UPI0039A4FFA4